MRPRWNDREEYNVLFRRNYRNIRTHALQCYPVDNVLVVVLLVASKLATPRWHILPIIDNSNDNRNSSTNNTASSSNGTIVNSNNNNTINRGNDDDDSDSEDDDDDSSLEEGFKITDDMKNALRKSTWLRNELQDGGLRDMISSVVRSGKKFKKKQTGWYWGLLMSFPEMGCMLKI